MPDDRYSINNLLNIQVFEQTNSLIKCDLYRFGSDKGDYFGV